MTRASTVLLVAAVLLAASCGDDDVRGDAVRVGPFERPDAVTLAGDQTLQVRLRGNRTTGYQWEVADPGILLLVDESYEADSGDMDGVPGTVEFLFEPAGTGTGTLVLIFHRPWKEGDEPSEVYEIEVTVTP